MKTTTTILSLLLCAGVQAQSFTEQTIDLTASYENDVYYDLTDASGEEEEAKNWHLAFGLGNGDATIHFQDSWGNKLYRTTFDVADWATIDTTGISVLTPLTNSTETWGVGALNQDPVDPSSGFDLGWGSYDLVTHHVNGSAVYIAEIDGEYYKLFINHLKAGKYTFQYEKMTTGSTLVSKTITKADYSDRRLIHFNLVDDQVFEREPEMDEWQFVIGKYIDFAPTVYPVVGVRTRAGIEVAQVENTDPENVDYSTLTFGTEINTVGYDWKTFNMGTFSFDLTEDLSYVLREEDGTLHHFYFSDYEGSSTGIVKLMYKAAAVSVEEIEGNNTILLASNPVLINESVKLNLENCLQVQVFDQLGNLVESMQNPGSETLLSFSKSGLYMIQAVFQNESVVEKLIVQ